MNEKDKYMQDKLAKLINLTEDFAIKEKIETTDLISLMMGSLIGIVDVIKLDSRHRFQLLQVLNKEIGGEK